MESSFLKHGVVFPERVMEASPFWEYNFHTISFLTKLKVNNQKTAFNKRHKFQTQYVEGISIGNILRLNSGVLTHKSSILILCMKNMSIKLLHERHVKLFLKYIFPTYKRFYPYCLFTGNLSYILIFLLNSLNPADDINFLFQL